MMLRATVVDVNPRDPTRVWVTIPQKYGTKPLRVFTRVEVTKGDHVYVANTSVTRVPQWVVFDQQTEIGRWGNPYPHTHPMGQVDGLVDWVKEYEAWAKDHTARLDAADKQIADGKLVVTQVRKDLDQAQTDIAEAVRKATLEQARLDQAEANLDQMGRNLTAAGGRISANETALSAAQKRIDAAESTVAQASKDLTAVSGRLDTTAKDLTTLQGTVGDVSAKATASDQKATDALTKAGAAQASADGKTTITRATSPASQPGKAVGDTHFTMSSMGGGGVVTRQQRWDGSTWQDETVGHQVLASLDLGKATVGEMDGGRIRAGSLYADRIVAGMSQNMVPDPGFINAELCANRLSRALSYGDIWRFSDGQLINEPASGGRTAASNISLSVVPDLYSWAAYPGMKLSISITARATSGTGGFRWSIRVKYRDGSTAFTAIDTPYTPLDGTWRTYSTSYNFPDNVASYSLTLQIDRTSTGAMAFRAPMAAAKTGTVLIEDGAVTGDKVEAQTVAAKVGQFVKVQAQNVEVTGELAARVVNSMDTTTRNLVVTESAILQHTTLLGTTVADELNVRKLIRGRDAILDGTLDVAQLNVTGEMSAKIISTATLQARQGFFTDGLTAQDAALLGTTVAENLVVTDAFSARVVNAMTAQTKQLVVTEDAILNKATVIQSLVTPELIAQKADIRDLASRMITSGLLQTHPAANRGVKVDNNGIRAWDDAGRQTVNLNGKSNYITGTFATAEKEQRVEIKSGGSVAAADFFGSGNTVDHLGVWHQADAGVNTVSKIVSQNQAKMQDGNPGLLMYPFRGEFAFRGRWAKESDTVKFVKLRGAGLPAGGWIDLRITYVFPFSSLYSDLHTIVSAESWSGQEILATVITNAADQLLVRLVNKSSKSSGTVILHAAAFSVNSVAGYTEYA